ncbi:MAG TPA: phosphate ABC transporter substrate-binding protein PstS [Candidatus Acidoferrales bacterium]|jgi:phosphate transport system substrate-binding protein|nr:phosphate ABC transporter substrate-binding protein PstS [Candidatus Acidoferrales bacterium]
MKTNKLVTTVISGLVVGVFAASCSKNPAGNSPASGGNAPSSPILINGAGSTFDYPAFTKWFEVYAEVDTNVQFNYQSIGSGAGQKQLLNQTVDFGASDAPMSDESMAGAPSKILHLPVVAGGVAIIYNLPGNPKLKLDGDILAEIYLGKITKWNDPKIAALNSGVTLPDSGIIPVHRSDGSGTTFIFTAYLSVINDAWANSVKKGTAVKWPDGVGIGAKGSEGVAGQVRQISGSMGYAELAYADQNKIPYADMKNAAGQFVSPAPDSVSAALGTATIPDDFRFSMVNAPGAKAYPIAGPSWILIYQKQNGDRGKHLVGFLKWAITDGQKISPILDYAPLPDALQQRELKLVDSVTY